MDLTNSDNIVAEKCWGHWGLWKDERRNNGIDIKRDARWETSAVWQPRNSETATAISGQKTRHVKIDQRKLWKASTVGAQVGGHRWSAGRVEGGMWLHGNDSQRLGEADRAVFAPTGVDGSTVESSTPVVGADPRLDRKKQSRPGSRDAGWSALFESTNSSHQSMKIQSYLNYLFTLQHQSYKAICYGSAVLILFSKWLLFYVILINLCCSRNN